MSPVELLTSYTGLLLLTVAIITLYATGWRRIDRSEIKRLQEDVSRLSEQVRELQTAEQRRFLKEINTTIGDRKSIAA